jgi:hypothetical protein
VARLNNMKNISDLVKVHIQEQNILSQHYISFYIEAQDINYMRNSIMSLLSMPQVFDRLLITLTDSVDESIIEQFQALNNYQQKFYTVSHESDGFLTTARLHYFNPNSKVKYS